MAGGSIYRKFGGKRFTVGERGFKARRDADKYADGLRKRGKSVRVVSASKHDKEAHGINWEVFVR